MKTILSWRRYHYRPIVSVFLIMLTMITLIAGMVGCGPTSSQNLEIRTWYDLDAIRDNLDGDYILINNLDSTTAGYTELASPTANEGKGWQPIGTELYPFTGSLDGQGYEISDLFIDRPAEHFVGLFGTAWGGGAIKDIGVVNVDVTGYNCVSGLVGEMVCTVSNCYSTGNVTGAGCVGGLVGASGDGSVSNCYSTGNVTGGVEVGGLVGRNSHGTVSNCYSTGNVTGGWAVGGLVGDNFDGTVSNSYSTGSVIGDEDAGGLVGYNLDGTVSSSFWDTQTSGQLNSDGGIGKTTLQMKDIDTFSAWDIIGVDNSNDRNTDCIWNIVDDETYPFLSWELVS